MTYYVLRLVKVIRPARNPQGTHTQRSENMIRKTISLFLSMTFLVITLIFPSLVMPLGLGLSSANAQTQQPPAVPKGNGQLVMPPKLFKAGVDDNGREYFLNGQPAQQGKLILTASNGFFDKGICRAEGESSLPKVGDDDLIKPNFAFLGQWKSTVGSLRWHIWVTKPGKVRMSFNMRVPKAAVGSELTVQMDCDAVSEFDKFLELQDVQVVNTVESTPEKPQKWDLEFQLEEPGEHTITVSAAAIADPKIGVGELHSIDLFGEAIEQAQLLRARWRPAAVHGGYASSQVKQSRMWVIRTRSVCDYSSYSPITTPFGYFGTSFAADRRVKGDFNFSMWAAGRGGEVPPLHRMPHLLAAGSPDAQFSGFGHEGSGVKLRGWTSMPDRPTNCIQALRVQNDGEYDTYHGYFWDHPGRRWKLYAIGRKWHGGKPMQNLKPGSFCEIPGPPHTQRSGDRVREVRRRGWHFGDDRKWHAMDQFTYRYKSPMNKYWYITDDGEFAMGTGGMRYYAANEIHPHKTQTPLPAYLSPAATKQLYELPVEIDGTKVVDIGSDTATVDVSLKRAGTNARATVYYGTTDCLTFAKRKLHGTERNSKVSASTQQTGRSWAHSIEIDSIRDGINSVKLKGLSPKTKYYYRVLISNDEGKIWTFKTHSFRTQN